MTKTNKNEQQINEFLIQGFNLYKEYKKKKKHEEALLILQVTSQVANKFLNRKTYSKVYCRKCKKQLTNGREIQFYNDVGECLGCDHVGGEQYE